MLKKNSKERSQGKFSYNGRTIDDSSEIANAFNNYFTQIGPSLDKKIPPAHNDFMQFLGQPNISSFFLDPTSTFEICEIVGSFKNVAAGVDHVSPRVVKSVIGSISDPLCYIINLSLTTGIFPDKLKLARVTAIFKSVRSNCHQQLPSYFCFILLF